MILGRPLTPEERRISQKNYEIYNFINGASYMCLGENVLILYATQLKAPNWVVALLGSMIFLGYLLLPLGIRRTARRGAAISQADFWVRRNLAALLTAAAVLVAYASPPAAWGVVLVGAFLFYGYRAAGCVLSIPLVGDFSTPEEAPIAIGRATSRFYSSGCVMIAVVTLVAAKFPGRWSLVGIIVFGALLGVTSSTFLRNIHETGALLEAARKPFLPGLRAAFRNADLRRLTLGWFGLNFAKLLLFPISILALKRGCGFSDSAALVCAIAQFTGSCLISKAGGRACRRFGPHRVLSAFFACNFLVVAAWLLMPAEAVRNAALAWPLALPLFFLLGCIDTAGNNAASSYFLMVCPDKAEQVSGAVSLNLVTGVAAGLVGSALAPWLIHRAGAWAPGAGPFFHGGLGLFRLYFAALLPLLALCQYAISRMRVVLYDFRDAHGEKAVDHAVALGHHQKH